MNPTDRTRLMAWVTLYSALGLGWAGFARWVVPPMLVAEPPGRLAAALKAYLHVPPVVFLCQDTLGRWREVSGAALIALALHLTIVAILRRCDPAASGRRSPREARAARRMNLTLGLVAAAFLAVAVISPMRQDYFFYLEIWYHVRHGQDPWFYVFGMNGKVPLNAYGPLFNPLAGLAWINPVAPRLLFTYAYILFAISMTRGFEAGRPPSGVRSLGLLILFWNPFPWVEVAFYGHFDVLIGLACLGAVRAWIRGWDIRSGGCLAAGVLLKYLPIVLLPFLAIDRDRGRIRIRFLAVALATIAAGLVASCLIWGTSTFLPLELAATRQSTTLSIFRFLHGPYSPLGRLGFQGNVEDLATPALLLALGGAWWWSWLRKPDIETSALVAVLVLVVSYRVGYPQYQMVPFVLGSAWLLGHWDRLKNRTAPLVAMALYFGWLAAFDVDYMLDDAWKVNIYLDSLQDAAGLPTFLLGLALVVCVALSAAREVPDAVGRPHASGATE
jgi:Glycosyltransferase family 87